MRSRWMIVLLPALILLFASCGGDDDNPAGGNGDVTGPAMVTDLAAAAAGDSSITLVWTAPGDPAKTASVATYDIRYSLSPIDAGTWAGADTLAGEPVPGAPDEAETLAVAGLDLGTTYYFALRSEDDSGNLSALSNPLAAATDSIDDRLIAYYPLVADGEDVTGFHGAMNMIRSPFQEGGIFCSGLSASDDPQNGSHAGTVIDSLDFNAFTISARFKPAVPEPGSRPLFVGGDLYRWISFRLESDSTVALTTNGGQLHESGERYTPGQWHEGRITYDGQTARLYLDGVLACEAEGALTHGDDRGLGVTNGGSGKTFHGIFGRLKVYDGVVAP